MAETAQQLARLAQDAQMTDHHLDTLRRVATPNRHESPDPDTRFRDEREFAMVRQVRRAAHCANRFLDGLETFNG